MEVYFDNSATTKVLPSVADLVLKVMTEDYGNPSSMHRKGVEAEKYIKEKSIFFDLKLSDGKIVVVPLKSLEEFQQEGEIMHHCVFTNEYYKKKDTLILSARIGKKHVETVEVNLKTLSIVQSRGVCNQNTEYHERIIGLVTKNMNLIRQKLTA